MCKEDLAFNNLQGLICHKTQPTNYQSLKDCSYLSIYLSI